MGVSHEPWLVILSLIVVESISDAMIEHDTNSET